MMLKVIVYAHMNNLYSCSKIEKQPQRDIHYIWLAAQERPDYVTVDRFGNRVKNERNNIFSQLVLLLADRGFISLDVEYIDGTKIDPRPTSTLSCGAGRLRRTGQSYRKRDAYCRFRHFAKDKVTMHFAFFAIAFNIKKICSKMATQARNRGK